MLKLKPCLRRLSIGIAAMLVLAAPASAGLSAAVSPIVSAQSAPADIARPTGSAAESFTYNPITGLWENNYYTFNPTTKETQPKQALEYTYNPATGLWDSTIWEYHPTVNAYEPVAVAVPQPPAGAVTHGAPQPAATPPATEITSAPSATAPADLQSAQTLQLPAAPLETTGPASIVEPAITARLQTSVGVTLNTDAISTAQSGNALGQNNYAVQDATSGDAAALATIINLLQSSAGLGNGNVATFVKDIQGDVNGDLLIDPAAFLQSTSTPQDIENMQITTSMESTINNNIDLSAISGDATLDDNYTAGSATTGSANAVANVVNLINSVIAANQSFLGVVNIYGNYTGDILVPTDTLNSLLASTSTPLDADVTQAAQAAATTTTNSTQTITNNVDLSAVSGSAVQAGNTTTGDAATGNAMTNLTILNLTGHQVSAANSLLVFVNVLGKWVGVIMDAPTGATSAAFAGGAANGTTQAPSNQPDTSNTALSSTQTVTNTIRAHAESGDATVSNNFQSGDARTGNATASANIANLLNSAFNLSDWFGVLFINVFGNWLGNFGLAKPIVPATDTANVGEQTPAPAVFSFTPGAETSDAAGSGPGLARVDRAMFADDAQYEAFNQQVAEVLAAHDVAPSNPRQAANDSQSDVSGFNLSFLPIALGLTGLAAVGAERIRSIRRR